MTPACTRSVVQTEYGFSNEVSEEGYMSRAQPMQWLSDRLKIGLSDLPENAAWLLERARAASANTRSGGELFTVRSKRRDSVSVVPPSTASVESRMNRARAAANEAQRIEERALAASRISKDQSEHARQVSQAGQTRLAETKREAEQAVKEREAEARRAAEKAVEREVDAARAKADAQVQAVESQVEQETEAARQEAQQAQAHAQELMAEAARRLHEARQLAQEAREAAVAVAEEAQLTAQRLQADANAQLREAEARVSEAEGVGYQATVAAERTARDLQSDEFDLDLDSQTKAELLDLAAAMQIDGRTTMSKAELVTAIAKNSRANR